MQDDAGNELSAGWTAVEGTLPVVPQADWLTAPLVRHSVSATLNGGSAALMLYGGDPPGSVGAVLKHDSTCTVCRRRFEAGDVVTAELAPEFAGTWHHTDCDDPRLEQDVP